MKYNLHKFLIVIFCINYGVNHSCSASPSIAQKNENDKLMAVDSNYKKVRYDTTILLIEKKASNNVSWDELFEIKEFVNLYEHSVFYTVDAINFLKQKEFTAIQKRICINTMQRSNLEDYIRFCKECKFLYDSNSISEDILKWVIIPNFSKTHVIVRNYENEAVKKFLNDIRNDSKISAELKRDVKNILSGESWRKIKSILAIVGVCERELRVWVTNNFFASLFVRTEEACC